MTLKHQPIRPRWTCGGCREPWPCSELRLELFEEAEGDRVYLSIYLGLYHAQAVEDVAGDDLYDQFFGWIYDPSRRRPRAHDQGAET